MTITRIWQAGFETGEDNVEATKCDVMATTVSVPARTGNYMATLSGNWACVETIHSSLLPQCRFGGHIFHGTPYHEDSPLITFYAGSAKIIQISWLRDSAEWVVKCGDDELTRVADPAWAMTDVWSHLGVDFKLHASAGWVCLYRDGVPVIAYAGQTDFAGSAVNRIFMGYDGAVGWSMGSGGEITVVDDLYWDDTTGEAAPAPPPDLRFFPVTVNGNGAYSQLTGSDGNSTDNYLLVDEIPDDADATYVGSDIPGLRDSYAMSSVTLEPGWAAQAVIGLAQARKLAAEGGLQAKLFVRYGGANLDAAAAALGTSYGLTTARFPLDPAGNGWGQTSIDGLELGIATE